LQLGNLFTDANAWQAHYAQRLDFYAGMAAAGNLHTPKPAMASQALALNNHNVYQPVSRAEAGAVQQNSLCSARWPSAQNHDASSVASM